MNILNFLWRDNLSYFLLNSRQIMCPDKREKTPHVRLLASLINSQVLFWEEKKKKKVAKVAYSCGTEELFRPTSSV